jgi:hypothetical protein
MRQRSVKPSSLLNPPDVPVEQKQRALAGERPVEDQAVYIERSDVDTRGPPTPTHVYEGELPDAAELELPTDLELRAGETDDPMVAVEEGYTYVPPIDPPVVPGRTGTFDNAVIASGLGVSALDEPYDESYHGSFMPDDDEICARVREAIRADSSTSPYADTIAIAAREGVVVLCGEVEDLTDNDNLLAVAAYVTGVEEVIDRLWLRGERAPC